jgi:AcrR family transcriptional regulator
MENVEKVAVTQYEQYAQARRDIILDAALSVFAQSGLAEAKMDQIAAAADLSKGSLHLYFPSKDSLLLSLRERYTLLPELPEMMASLGDTPPALGLPTLIAEIWRLMRGRKELARTISGEIQNNPERGKLFAEHIGLPSYQPLAGYLERWMNRGVLRLRNPLAAARCLIGMLWFFLLTTEVIAGEDFNLVSDETVVTTVVRMFLDVPAKAKRSTSHATAGAGRHQGSDETVVTTVARIVLGGAPTARKRAALHAAAGDGRHQGS